MNNLNSCQSCGMPMEKPDDYGGGNASNLYCKYCTDAQGNLLPQETVRQNMINFYNKTMGQTPEQAAVEVDKIMAKMPAWQGQVQPATPSVDDQVEPTPEPVSPSVPVDQPASEPTTVETPAPEMPAEMPFSEPDEPISPEEPAEPTEPVAGPAVTPVQSEEVSAGEG